ncbi:MAG: ADP-ribosylglycohydrolase family protein [Gammaproteobacteria bacterium]|nr:ADP-ribosylglycohydrolase family protein [Gammaproteobacteria bacterium]
MASNHGGDSDSTASIAGQIRGAWKGLEGVPKRVDSTPRRARRATRRRGAVDRLKGRPRERFDSGD